MADRPELKQTKTHLKKMIAELEEHWIAIGEARAAQRQNFQLLEELQKLEVGSPERKTEHAKHEREWRRLGDLWAELLLESRRLVSEAGEVLRECDFWFLEAEGQIERFDQLYDLWESSSDPQELVVVRRFVAKLKKLLSDTYSKLASETHDDAGEPLERGVGSGQSATTGGRGRGLETSRKRIDFCET